MDFFGTWWGITITVVAACAVFFVLAILLYRPFFKRFFDFIISGVVLLILSPTLLILTLVGAIAMGGNPFYTQQRPGKKEKIFKIVKFRTMNNKKDADGNLLPDEKRLTSYGKFLRATSLDELPELFNIFIGNMAIVGPRPLLVEYLPRYSEEHRKRHDVRPGLTGLAQVNGRNLLSWKEKFDYDVEYVKTYSLWKDLRIIFRTVAKVFKRDGISSETCATMEKFEGEDE